MKKILAYMIISGLIIGSLSIPVFGESTTDNEVISIKNLGSDGGINIKTKENYEEAEIKAYWTVEEYTVWLNNQKLNLQKILESGNRYLDTETGEWKEWTQEKVDEQILRYEQILELIKSGAKVEKSESESNLGIGKIQNPKKDSNVSTDAAFIKSK